jgi:cysteine desulfurase
MEIKKQIIYLDNNATTPIDKRVLDAMMPFLTTDFGNANSTHQFGAGAYEAVKTARFQVFAVVGKSKANYPGKPMLCLIDQHPKC